MANSNYGAVYAKIMALYGKRLTPADYEAISLSAAIPDIAAYLKNNTNYAELLRNVDERMIHRGQLEVLLQAGADRESIALCGFLTGSDRIVMQVKIRRSEINAILACLRHLIADTEGLFFFEQTEILKKYSKLPFQELANCGSIEEFSQKIKNTLYAKPLMPLLVSPLDYSLIESALYSFYYTSLCELFKEKFNKKISLGLCGYLGALLDLNNIKILYRLKKYYKTPPSDRFLLHDGLRVKRELRKKLVEAQTEPEFISLVRQTPYGRHIPEQYKDSDIENIELSFLKEYAKRIIRGAPSLEFFPAYLDLKELEIRNVTRIIECVRYGLSSEEIHAVII